MLGEREAEVGPDVDADLQVGTAAEVEAKAHADEDVNAEVPLRAEDVPAYVRALVPVLGRADAGARAHWVHDADEETSGLYSRPASGQQGLGYLPLASDLLYVHITRTAPVPAAPTQAARERAVHCETKSTVNTTNIKFKAKTNNIKSKAKTKTKTKATTKAAEVDDTPGPGSFVVGPGVTARVGARDELDEVHALLAGQAAARTPSAAGSASCTHLRLSRAGLPRAKGPVQSQPRPQLRPQPRPRPPAAFAALILQNQTRLRTHAGDTGSAVWRSTLKLAATVARRTGTEALLQLRRGMRVIEVGAGSGALPLLLASAQIAVRNESAPAAARLASGGTDDLDQEQRDHKVWGGELEAWEELIWLATDQEAQLPLLRKNAALANAAGSGLRVLPHSLDWTEALGLTHSQLGRYRRGVLSLFLPPARPGAGSGAGSDPDATSSAPPPDLLLAVDVVYNESIFPPLLATLTALCVPQRTVVLVLLELRQADMVGEFIAQWLAWDAEAAAPANEPVSISTQWHIVSLEPAALAGAGLDVDYALFVAWRS